MTNDTTGDQSAENGQSPARTVVNHAYVVRGSVEASDAILEAINDLPDAQLVYQTHSLGKLFVEKAKGPEQRESP